MPNGAQVLLNTMLNADIEVCFSNPGTSEMHFVAALDSAPEMRAVLVLFEGVATGAADGYARMADKPAATLLHLGCGLGNGLAGLHNACKARVPMLNIVGDHASYHVKYDALLQSDIETPAKSISPWVRTTKSTQALGPDAAEAIEKACEAPGSVSTLILPADASWGLGGCEIKPAPNTHPSCASDEVIERVAHVLNREGDAAIVLGGKALRENTLLLAESIAEHTGATLFAEAFPARIACGAGRPHVERIALGVDQFAEFDHLILVDVVEATIGGASSPTRWTLASSSQDALSSLTKLCAALGTERCMRLKSRQSIEYTRVSLDVESACLAMASVLPEDAIIADESHIAPSIFASYFSSAAKHDLLTACGGAIGQSLPLAIGAAIASPQRRVFALVDSEHALPAIQSLWTMARESLNIQVLVLKSRGKARSAHANNVDFARLAKGMSVPGCKVSSVQDFVSELTRGMSKHGPSLIEVELA